MRSRMIPTTRTILSTPEAIRTAPPPDCELCPRLVAFREANRRREPGWFNGPVPSWGDDRARLLVVGLAPGMKGANRTGRPFTGDHAGDLLYATLKKFAFASGTYEACADDGFELHGCAITNAVRCVPPQNRPVAAETAACRTFLQAEINTRRPALRVILALGRIAHDNVLSALGCRRAAHPFGHNARHDIDQGLTLVDSYHCSRYNTNTGRLTESGFDRVFSSIRLLLYS